MRIHTDTLRYEDILNAVRTGLPGVDAQAILHGSRSHRNAYEIRLTGNSPYRPNDRGRTRDAYAATWDEWGVFLGRLYVIDPAMMVGNASSPIYRDAEHFHWSTGVRFAGIGNGPDTEIQLPHDTHKRHRWEYVGRCVTGAYRVHKCKGSKGNPCSAIIRRMAHGRDWSEISDAEYVTNQLTGA